MLVVLNLKLRKEKIMAAEHTSTQERKPEHETFLSRVRVAQKFFDDFLARWDGNFVIELLDESLSKTSNFTDEAVENYSKSSEGSNTSFHKVPQGRSR